MDLIYTNADRVEQGVLQAYEMDLAFGADENDFECTVTTKNHVCENGSLLFFEGTEYGGMVDSIESNTATDEVTYSGRTWHGILNSKVLEPDSGNSYLVVNGEANAVLASLIARMGLSDLFGASTEDSGLTISGYKMNRYITGYDGIIKMLESVGGKLKIKFSDGVAVLSAHPIKDYTQDEEFDSDLVPFTAKRNYKTVNHLVCLGSGELSNRLVVHLYANAEGNISETQTFAGLNEITAVYEYSNISDRAELIAEGTEKFKELLSTDEIAIDFDADTDEFDVGDIIGAVDNVTGLSAYATIKKKVLAVKNGQFTISLEPNATKSGSTHVTSGGNGTSGDNAFSSCVIKPNLLDNSDFGNPVNQRGETVYISTTSAIVYTIDRWLHARGTLTCNDGFINWKSNNAGAYKRLMQRLGTKFTAGKTYTLAMLVRVNAVSGTVNFRLGNDTSPVSGATKQIKNTTAGFEWIVFSHTVATDIDLPCFDLLVTNTANDYLDIDLQAAAIYEGEYAADTLPSYQSKGYAAEFMECQRYLYRLSSDAASVTITGGTRGNGYAYFYLPLPVPLRGSGVPTVEHSGVDIYPFVAGSSVEITALTASILTSRNGLMLRATHAYDAAADRDALALRIGAGGYLSVNMEL